MKKIIYICDRCKKEIDENHYYIDIYQKPDIIGRYTSSGASNNMTLNISKMFGNESTYCDNCIQEIKNFINEKRVLMSLTSTEEIKMLKLEKLHLIKIILGKDKLTKRLKKQLEIEFLELRQELEIKEICNREGI